MPGTRKHSNCIDKETLNLVKRGLEDIKRCFERGGFLDTISTTSGDVFEEDDMDVEDPRFSGNLYDSVIFEVMIDKVVSSWIQSDIASKKSYGSLPLTNSLRCIFGDINDIIDKATEFERSIVGYFGEIAWADMLIAFSAYRKLCLAISNQFDLPSF